MDHDDHVETDDMLHPPMASDRQEGGAHYLDGPRLQPWDIVAMYGLDFYEGNILKYLLRRKGNRLEDMKKLRHYADKQIELLEGDDNAHSDTFISHREYLRQLRERHGQTAAQA